MSINKNYHIVEKVYVYFAATTPAAPLTQAYQCGFFMPEKRTFQKKPQDFQQLIERMKSKGLHVSDEAEAEQLLRDVGYYRLSGYGLAFEQYQNGRRSGRFKAGARLDDIVNAYHVDRKLRLLILGAVERIEVAVRGIICHQLSLKHNSAHWFMDARLFRESENFRHSGLLREIIRSTGKNAEPGSEKESLREVFIHHYYATYDSPEYPPSWMVAEVLSIGSWSKVFQHLSASSDKKLISSQLDLAPLTLESWLHCLAFIRNASAHHSRLFARKLPLPPKRDKKLAIRRENYVFNFICIIWYFLQQIEPDNTWLDEVTAVVNELTSSHRFLGIPEHGSLSVL